MDVFDAIKKRRSIRRYLPVPVEWEKVGMILDAGRLAPSAGNLQDWKFIVVLDPETKKKITESCLQQHWMNEAPVYIVVCSDTKKVGRFYGDRGEKLYSVQNCAGAMENMFIAATALELGMAWVGAFEERMIRRALTIPENISVQAVLTLGYPDEIPREPAKYTLENVVFLEKWGNRVKDIVDLTGEYSEYIRKALLKTKKLVEDIKAKAKKK